MGRSRSRQVAEAVGFLILFVLTGCAYILPRTWEVVGPVEDDLWLAVAADFEALIGAIAKILGFLGVL